MSHPHPICQTATACFAAAISAALAGADRAGMRETALRIADADGGEATAVAAALHIVDELERALELCDAAMAHAVTADSDAVEDPPR